MSYTIHNSDYAMFERTDAFDFDFKDDSEARDWFFDIMESGAWEEFYESEEAAWEDFREKYGTH